MIAYLWVAGDRYSGITDDPEHAKETAAERLKRGDVARVEGAIVYLGPSGWAEYALTGEGWKAIRPWSGPMTWEQLKVPSERAAS